MRQSTPLWGFSCLQRQQLAGSCNHFSAPFLSHLPLTELSLPAPEQADVLAPWMGFLSMKFEELNLTPAIIKAVLEQG